MSIRNSAKVLENKAFFHCGKRKRAFCHPQAAKVVENKRLFSLR